MAVVRASSWKAAALSAQPLIAIIDDDASLRLALAGLVRSLGYRARDHASAEDFLAANDDPACIVTDIQMPGLSGIELKDRLTETGRETPVIMITARDDEALHARARAAGAFCLLRKPFTGDALIECLEKALAGQAD